MSVRDRVSHIDVALVSVCVLVSIRVAAQTVGQNHDKRDQNCVSSLFGDFSFDEELTLENKEQQ